MNSSGELLEAAVLGYLVRKRLVRSVRDEFAGVAAELEAGGSPPREPFRLEWPRERTLCFPVFRETGGCRDGQEDHRPGRGDLTPDDSMEEGSTATDQQLGQLATDQQLGQLATDQQLGQLATDQQLGQLATDQQLGQLATQSSASILPERSCEPQERTQNDSTPCPSLTAQPSLQPFSAGMQSSSATLPSHTFVTNPAEEHAGVGARRYAVEAGSRSPGVGARRCAMEAGSRSPESELPELPRDRESLLGLRSQVAMELVWIKQAIASRQKYLQIRSKITGDLKTD